ncbi:MAG: phage tail tape measure protein [Clostridium sp.]|nr:phage tail tape measure protein [Clostridium sp.]
MANKKEYKVKIQIGGEKDSSLDKAFSQTKRELDNLYRFSKRTNQSFLSSVNKMDAFADKTFSFMAKGSAAASAGITGALAASTAAGASFESQMSTVQAISQASESEMARLKALAKQMGIETKFSATEAGQGLEYMAMAGWDVDSMLAGLPGIMNLAAPSEEDLGQVSDIVTDAMTAFNLEASRSAEFADVLAQASARSNTDVAMMGQTFKYVAPVAGALGFSIQDTATAIGLMANAGIKGEQAGTSLRAIFSRIVKPTAEVASAMERIGLSVTNSDGSMRSLDEILRDLRAGFSGLSESERASTAASLAGQEAMSGMLALVNASDEDYEKLSDSIYHAKGAAEEMAGVRMDNLKGDVTLLKSSAEGAGIAIYEGLSEPLREGVQTGTEWLNSFTESVEENLPTIRREVKSAGSALMGFADPVLDLGSWFLQHPEVIQGGLTGLVSALLTFKAAKGITSAVKLFGSLSGMITAWPVAAAGLAIGGIAGITSAMKAAARERAAKNLAEHFGDVTLSIEELGEAAKHVLGDDLFFGIEEMERSSTRADDYYQTMKDSMEAVQKMDWKLSMGIELKEGDAQEYVAAVDAYVQNAQDYITEKGYELNLAVDLVMGEAGTGLSEDSGAFYQALLAQLDPLKENISAALQDITENGLTLDKQKIVSDYLGQMAEITSMITEAENAAKLQMIQGKYAGAALDADSFQNLQAELANYTEQAIQSTDEAYQKVLTSLNAQRLAGEKGMEGGISQEEFDARSAEAAQSYYQSKAETILNGQQAMVDTIMATYGDEIEPVLEEVNQKLDEKVGEVMTNPYNMLPEDFMQGLQWAISEAMAEAELPSDAQDALGMLVKGMEPSEEQMTQLINQMKQSGQAIPQAFLEGMQSIDMIRAASGDEEGLWGTVGQIIAESPEQALVLEAARQQGVMFPQAAFNAIEAEYPNADTAARQFLEHLKSSFETGITANVPVSVSINTMMTPEGQTAVGKLRNSAKNLPGHAEGGIFDTPHIAAFAEKGPEAVVPLDGSQKAISIWQEAGKLLGAYEKNSYSRIYESLSQNGPRSDSAVPAGAGYERGAFQPVINIYGNTNREDINNGLMMTFEKWKEYMERYEDGRRRVSF